MLNAPFVTTLPEWYFALPWFVKVGMSLVLGGAFSFSLGVLAEYAGYFYALRYGIRPPLEGIPYLRVAVAITTAMILVGAIALGTALLLLAHAFVVFVTVYLPNTRWGLDLFPGFAVQVRINPNNLLKVLRTVKFSRVVGFALLFSLVLGMSVLLLTWLSASQFQAWKSVGAAAGASVASFWAMLILWNPRIGIWFATIAAVIWGFVVAPLLLFNTDVYGWLLRGLGYGGGLTVSVKYASVEGSPAVTVTGGLMLRTTSALLLYLPEENAIREVPLSALESIDHTAMPLYLLPVLRPAVQ